MSRPSQSIIFSLHGMVRVRSLLTPPLLSCPWCLSWLQELEKERDNLQNEKVAMMQASGQRDATCQGRSPRSRAAACKLGICMSMQAGGKLCQRVGAGSLRPTNCPPRGGWGEAVCCSCSQWWMNRWILLQSAGRQKWHTRPPLQPMVHGQKSCRGQGCAELGGRSESAVCTVRAVLLQKLQQLHAASEEERKRLETYYKDRITQYDEKLREVSGGCAGCWEKGTAHVRGLRIQGGEGDAGAGAGSVSWQ